jgi:hypothetical protein
MKTTFNTLYSPIKAGIEGLLFREEHKVNGELQAGIRITSGDKRFYGKKSILARYSHNGQNRALLYGKTIKEVKALVADINDFRFNPHLFINQ